MPARIVIKLEPESPGALPPPQTGPAVAAAVLRAIDRVDAELARRLHDGPRPKPYAITPVLDEQNRPPRPDSAQVRFEVGVLADELFAPVFHALMTEPAWRIGRTCYRNAGTEVSALTSYADIAAAARPVSSWGFRLHTPTAFATAKEEGARRQRTLPEPEWIFRALVPRWRMFTAGSPAADLPDTLPVAVEEHLEVVDFTLRLAEHLVKPGVPPVRGAVGVIRYALAEAGRVPADARRALDALATFARFAGLGDRTTVGMGYATPLPAGPPPRPRRSSPARSATASPTPPVPSEAAAR